MDRSSKCIQQRMMGQEIRNKLSDYWKDNEVKEKDEYAILTNIIHQEWSDLSVREHKKFKGDLSHPKNLKHLRCDKYFDFVYNRRI